MKSYGLQVFFGGKSLIKNSIFLVDVGLFMLSISFVSYLVICIFQEIYPLDLVVHFFDTKF